MREARTHEHLEHRVRPQGARREGGVGRRPSWGVLGRQDRDYWDQRDWEAHDLEDYWWLGGVGRGIGDYLKRFENYALLVDVGALVGSPRSGPRGRRKAVEGSEHRE